MLQTLTAITHPQIDPVMLSLGPLQVHWYGVSYVIGILFGWWYAKKLVTNNQLWGEKGSPMTELDLDDFLVWAVGGIILGGRIGYILFYDYASYSQNPLNILKVWEGGMSFHGGLAGITIAMIWFAKRRGFSPFSLFDVIAACCGIGLFLGRVANFINQELYGKVSTLPWAVIFPIKDDQPRHPSQLYEGILEGLVLFIILAILVWKFNKLHTPGFVGGAFIAWYGICRIFVEFFRIPDVQLGYFFNTGWITMGMMLSLPIIAIGMWAMTTAKTRSPA